MAAETLALAGAIVSLDRDGGVSAERGLVRKEGLRNASPGLIGDADNDCAPARRTGLPDRLARI